jgi:uncharacterized membrane protein YhaH (DUF805 family)
MVNSTRSAAEWIGTSPTIPQIIAVLAIGTIGITVAGLQPILLGSLLFDGHINTIEMGHAATAELLALGMGVAVGSAVFEGRPLRPIAILGSVILAAANVGTLAVSGEAVTVMRGLAGLGGGVLFWITTALIVRSSSPTLWSSVYVMCQAVVQCAVATGVAAWAPEQSAAVPIVLAVLAFVALIVVPAAPRRFAPLPKEPTSSGLPPARGWAVLVTTMLLQASILGAWVYFEPLGHEAGLTARQIALSTPLSLAFQLIGGGIAIAAAPRVPWAIALGTASLLLAAVLVGLSFLPPPVLFLTLCALFGSLWIFVTPYLTPFAIENDPTRRTAVLNSGAILVGSALGPLAASAIMDSAGATATLRICAACAIVAMVLTQALHLIRASGGPAADRVEGRDAALSPYRGASVDGRIP